MPHGVFHTKLIERLPQQLPVGDRHLWVCGHDSRIRLPQGLVQGGSGAGVRLDTEEREVARCDRPVRAIIYTGIDSEAHIHRTEVIGTEIAGHGSGHLHAGIATEAVQHLLAIVRRSLCAHGLSLPIGRAVLRKLRHTHLIDMVDGKSHRTVIDTTHHIEPIHQIPQEDRHQEQLRSDPSVLPPLVPNECKDML